MTSPAANRRRWANAAGCAAGATLALVLLGQPRVALVAAIGGYVAFTTFLALHLRSRR